MNSRVPRADAAEGEKASEPAGRMDLGQALAIAVAKANEGNEIEALGICDSILAQVPGNEPVQELQRKIYKSVHIKEAHAAFPGPDYREWLRWFHNAVKPKYYLEIGVNAGQSLQFARPPTRAIGVDPDPKITFGLSAWTRIFKSPSDAFFADTAFLKEIGEDELDLVFIDGLHTFDQALTDFINAERFSHKNTTLIFHDTLPVTPVTAARDRQTIFWVGDTWKVVPILLETRPDLVSFTIPTYPSGLTVVTNLDAGSTALSDNYGEIVDRWMPVSLESSRRDWDTRLRVVANDFREVGGLLNLDPSSA